MTGRPRGMSALSLNNSAPKTGPHQKCLLTDTPLTTSISELTGGRLPSPPPSNDPSRNDVRPPEDESERTETHGENGDLHTALKPLSLPLGFLSEPLPLLASSERFCKRPLCALRCSCLWLLRCAEENPRFCTLRRPFPNLSRTRDQLFSGTGWIITTKEGDNENCCFPNIIINVCQ